MDNVVNLQKILAIITEISVLMVYVLIGYIIKKLKMISEAGVKDISRIVVNIAMPLLVIKSLNIEYKQEYVKNMLIVAVGAFVFLVFTSTVSRLVVRRSSAQEREKVTMNYCMIFGNLSFLGYPLCQAAFGSVGMLYNSVYLAVQNIFQWTVGVSIFKVKRKGIANLKNLINPGIIGIAVGLILFFLGIRPGGIIKKSIEGVGNISVPLALMVIGASLEGKKILEILFDRKILLVSAFKMLVFPVVYLVLLRFVPMNTVAKSIIMISASTPIQASSAVFAKNFGGDTDIPARCVFLTTLMCIATTPLFLLLINL